MFKTNRVKILRIKEKKTQKELANDLNVSRDCIVSWENQRTTIPQDKIIKLAAYFGVTTDYLLGVEPARDSPGGSGNRSSAEPAQHIGV